MVSSGQSCGLNNLTVSVPAQYEGTLTIRVEASASVYEGFIDFLAFTDKKHMVHKLHIRYISLEVLSVQAQGNLLSKETNLMLDSSNGKKAIFGYEYRYDERGNIVKKFLPQCGYIQYWYDNDNRLIYMQDGRMREKGLYRFYLYDKLSRVVVEGTCTSCNRGKNVTRTTLDTKQSGFLGTGYIIGHDLRLENPKLEVVNYYDNYDCLNLPLASINHGLDWQQQIASDTNTTGLVTGTYSVASDNSPLLDVFCYNAKGQVIQSFRVLSENSFLKQGTKYTFTGKPEKTSQLLFKDGRGYTTETDNSYNKHNDQLESTTLSVNGTQMKVSSLEYDDLGRIKSNKQGQTSTEYTYNLRGWTTDIVNPKFEEHLTYNDGSIGTPYFSGNISTQQWKTADDNILRGYKFTYDKLNRLTDSEYGEGSSLSTNLGRYNEFIQGYTANGTITKLLRNGLMQNGSYGAIDDLSITLNGNQLSSIEEKAAPVLRAGSFDFHKVSSPSDGQDEYMYDENGALIYDANRGITKIEYDLRNNPRLIQFSDGSQTEYVYSALGEKLKTIHRTATLYSSSFDGNDTVVDGNPTSNSFPMPRLLSSGEAAQITDTATCQDMTAITKLSIDSTEYIGNFIFENGRPDKFLFPGGYYSYAVGRPTRTGGDGGGYYYYLTDHLGNNRVVVNANGDIEQTTHYYPFGAIYADAGKNPDFQKFKYTGKELDLTHGLNTYDHGARQNYSILGVWDRVDPLAEIFHHISPYTVCYNNPISFYDGTGGKGELKKIGGVLLIGVGTLVSAASVGTEVISAGTLTIPSAVGFKAGLSISTLGIGLFTAGTMESFQSNKPTYRPSPRMESHTPKKQSNGNKKRTEGRHMHGQTHGGGVKPNFTPQNNKRKKDKVHREKGKIIN